MAAASPNITLYSNQEGRGRGQKMFPSHSSVISPGRKIFPSNPQQIFIYISLETSSVCQNSQTCQSLPSWLVAECHINRRPSPPPPNYLKIYCGIILMNFQDFLFILVISKSLNYLEFIFGFLRFEIRDYFFP